MSTQVRGVHTDLQVPDFSDVRRKASSDPYKSAKETVEERNGFTYLITGGNFLKS